MFGGALAAIMNGRKYSEADAAYRAACRVYDQNDILKTLERRSSFNSRDLAELASVNRSMVNCKGCGANHRLLWCEYCGKPRTE